MSEAGGDRREAGALYRGRRHLPPDRPPRATVHASVLASPLGRPAHVYGAYVRLNEAAYDLLGHTDAVRLYYDHGRAELALEACEPADDYAWRVRHRPPGHHITITPFWRDVHPSVEWPVGVLSDGTTHTSNTRACRCRRDGARLLIALSGPTVADDVPLL